jgi:phosphoglycolate phosphatase-like HAD superfamily hydrolase
MVGDRDTDVECARAAGLRAILTTQGREPERSSDGLVRVGDLPEAAEVIVGAPVEP